MVSWMQVLGFRGKESALQEASAKAERSPADPHPCRQQPKRIKFLIPSGEVQRIGSPQPD
jgi:hypothetical protein